MGSCKEEAKSDVASYSGGKDLKLVPKLEVLDFKGLQKYLTTTSDTTYVVNFWATWCAPCVKELPTFEQLYSNFSDKKVKVILVSLDFPRKYDSNLKPFIEEHRLKAKVIALNDPDSNSWIPKISEDWSGTIPATLIYNKDKRQFYEQSFTYVELKNQVKQFLK
ncbi:MAG: TlpA disulfide reductase family protein [Aquaticitalea sp.]